MRRMPGHTQTDIAVLRPARKPSNRRVTHAMAYVTQHIRTAHTPCAATGPRRFRTHILANNPDSADTDRHLSVGRSREQPRPANPAFQSARRRSNRYTWQYDLTARPVSPCNTSCSAVDGKEQRCSPSGCAEPRRISFASYCRHRCSRSSSAPCCSANPHRAEPLKLGSAAPVCLLPASSPPYPHATGNHGRTSFCVCKCSIRNPAPRYQPGEWDCENWRISLISRRCASAFFGRCGTVNGKPSPTKSSAPLSSALIDHNDVLPSQYARCCGLSRHSV